MADPTNLYRHLPDTYDQDADSDEYKILAGLAEGTENARTELTDYRLDLALSTADGEGLDWWGENFSLARPPGMIDTFYRNVVSIIAGGRRGTVAIIKAVLEAATGLTWTVKDRQLDVDQSLGLGIPAFEVWAFASATGNAYGRAYAGYDTHIDDYPEESGVGGPILNDMGLDGGRFNDHAWGPLSAWELAFVDKVRPAGVSVIFKEF